MTGKGAPTPGAITSGVPAPAPRRPGNDASLGGRVLPAIHVVNHIHGVGDPESTAALVQRRIEETMNYCTHDVEHDLT
jgi:hypothetical protein